MDILELIEESALGNIKKGEKFINEKGQIITYDGFFFVYKEGFLEGEGWRKLNDL